MLPQERLIARVVDLCRTDDRLDAVLQYGSFPQGSADKHSDIEFWLFSSMEIDEPAWCGQIAPITHLVRNEFGATVVFFTGLVRGEFHFAATADLPRVGEWPARGAATDRMVVVDRTGALRKVLDGLPEHPVIPGFEEVCGRFANWLVLAHHTASRGEALRATDALAHVQRHLLWMARLADRTTGHWLTPSRLAEQDLSARRLASLDTTSPAAAWPAGCCGWSWPSATAARSPQPCSPTSTMPSPDANDRTPGPVRELPHLRMVRPFHSAVGPVSPVGP